MKLRALIFDDDEIIRMALGVICTDRGNEVFAYPDPVVWPLSAMTQCPCPAGTVCADLIISDIQMPVVNGLDFIQMLADMGCRCPHIAIVSGGCSKAERERAARLGCKMIPKPFENRQILEWLDLIERSIPVERRLFDF